MSSEDADLDQNARDILSRLGDSIRRLREARGWSLERLAKECGRHFTYLGRVERGQQNVSLVVLDAIARGLKVPLEELLREETHPLLQRWGIAAFDVLQAIEHGFRTQVDVRGKLAEWMLFKTLLRLRDDAVIHEVIWHDQDGRPDFEVQVEPHRSLIVECKNLRSAMTSANAQEPFRVEIQKTRNSKDGAPSRFYGVDHFDILSVCLFNRTGRWEFRHARSGDLVRSAEHSEKLKVMQEVPQHSTRTWRESIEELF